MTSPDPDTPARSETPLILIVDDSEKNRKLARDVLRRAGLRTVEASNGADAIAIANECLPDVILMDLQLPDMDGAVATQKLAEGTRTSHIPVVAVSARSPYEADSLLAAGFAGFIEKPVRVGDFPGQVRGYCERRAAG